MDSLDDWSKRFIKKDNLEADELIGMLEKISKYCEISESGFVRLINGADKSLSKKERIYLVISARYVANRLQKTMETEPTISSSISSQEISDMLMIDKASVQARASEYRKENKLTDVAKGVYEARSHGVKDFLEEIDKPKKK